MISMITGKEQKVPRYEYLSIYAGQIKVQIAFPSAKEANAHYAAQAEGLSTSDAHRAILRKNGKTIKDTWHVG
jgi:hypothetical protein